MRCIFTLLVAAKLVAGEPLVFILPSSDKEATTNQHGNRGAFVETKDVDFGRQLYATDIKHRGLLSDKTSKDSHKLDQSKIKHPKKAAFQSAGETGLLDFDNPLEDIFTSKFHTKDMDRRLGKSSKSKSSKTAWNDWHSPDVSSNWHDGKSSKSKSSDWHAPNDGKSSKSKSNKAKSSESKSSKSKSSKSKSSKSKSSKSKSSDWSGYNASGSVSASKSAKGHGYESRGTSIDFSYQIGSYSLWSLDESRDSTLDELVEPSTQVKTTVTASPVSASAVTASPVSAKPVHLVEPNPREETLVVSELANIDSSNAINTPAVTSANESAAVDGDVIGSNRMYYVAGAALFGGLVTFFASVFIKRKIQSDDTHTKLNESTSQDETEDTPPSDGSHDGSHSYNIDAIQPSTTSQSDCEWSHPDSWLAFDMQA